MIGLAKFVGMLRSHYAEGCTARIGAEYAAAIVAEYDALKARAESARCEPVEAGGCAPPVIASVPAGSCSANGFGHKFGPHGPAGRRQCEYCGEAQQPADPVGTILREVCELEPADPDNSNTVIVKFDDLHRILARNIVPQPHQPAEAVAVDLERFREPVLFWHNHCYSALGQDSALRVRPEALRLLAIIDNAPAAIDIGKLRELVARWRADASGGEGYNYTKYEEGRIAEKRARASELAALIGDGGEVGNG